MRIVVKQLLIGKSTNKKKQKLGTKKNKQRKNSANSNIYDRRERKIKDCNNNNRK
jgi:hypothetical protein